MTKAKAQPDWDVWQFNGEDRWNWPVWLKRHPYVTFGFDWSNAGESQHIKDARMYIYTDDMRADIGDWIGLDPNGKLYVVQPPVEIVSR